MNATDLAGDCAGFDGAEAVTIELRRPGGTTTLVIAGALRRALAGGEREFGGVSLTGDELVWHVPEMPLAGASLRPGDTISTGNEEWMIAAVKKSTLGTRWQCVCRLRLEG